MLYFRCNSSALLSSSSLLCMNLSALLITDCMLCFSVLDIVHNGTGGYSIIGISKDFTRVTFVYVGKLLNRLSLVNTALPLFLIILL